MKDALVHARLALQDLREGITITERRLGDEQRELDTVTRRRNLAAQIDDADTVTVAEDSTAGVSFDVLGNDLSLIHI